jgi:hypothetical protein
MSNVSTDTVMWHDDGHVIWLELNKAEVVVTTVICPAKDSEAPCRHHKVGCLVQYFVNRYGLDCNVGVCPASDQLRIAWAFYGDVDDLDAAQVWIVPVDDDVFSAWASNMRGT